LARKIGEKGSIGTAEPLCALLTQEKMGTAISLCISGKFTGVRLIAVQSVKFQSF
jgi:hypothetical protein